jgi:hypothetical protein
VCLKGWLDDRHGDTQTQEIHTRTSRTVNMITRSVQDYDTGG